VADFIGETNILNGTITGTANGYATVTTGIGTFSATLPDADWQPKAGEQVLISIRPESWRLSAEPAATNAVKGRIGESTYLGEMAQHQFKAGDFTLKIYEMNPRHTESGAEIYAAADAEDVIVLPAKER